MTTLPATRPRRRLRHAGDALPGASIGIAPIIWNNVDDLGLAPAVEAALVLDEIARTGYEGTQEGRGFPRGEALRDELARRDLRLAEVYVSLPCTADGPTPDALALARERLAVLHGAGGEVLVAALEVAPERAAWAGRASDAACPRLTAAGWDGLAALVNRLADETVGAGHRFAWHQHTATYVETPVEAARLFELTDPARVGVCLDAGHWTVGGGDPVEAARRLGPRVTHVHLKDVDPDVLAGLRAGELTSWSAALRARLFTELGAGMLDLAGLLEALDERDFAGWLMVEQDSGWEPPSESAAVSRRVLGVELRRLGAARAARGVA